MTQGRMTDDEWDAIALLLDQCWKGEFTDERARSYRVFLDRHPADLVIAALERLVQDGSPFLPAVAEIVKAINQLTAPAIPPWTEVWPAMQRAMKRDTPEDAVAYVEEHAGLFAAGFYSLENHDVLRMTPFFDEDWGRLRIDELHKRWTDYTDRVEERARSGRALDAARLRRGIGQPERIDFLKAAGVTPPAKQLPSPAGKENR